MKCLLCSSKFKDQKALLDHYLSYHNIDQNNWFFQKIFQAKNKILLRNCVRCSKFLTTEKHKATHEHGKDIHEYGKDIPFEEKPLDIVSTSFLASFILSTFRSIVIFITFTTLKRVLMIF